MIVLRTRVTESFIASLRPTTCWIYPNSMSMFTRPPSAFHGWMDGWIRCVVCLCDAERRRCHGVANGRVVSSETQMRFFEVNKSVFLNPYAPSPCVHVQQFPTKAPLPTSSQSSKIHPEQHSLCSEGTLPPPCTLPSSSLLYYPGDTGVYTSGLP